VTANLRLVASNDGDTAALTSGDFESTLPVGNLQLEGRARVARTTDATGAKTILGEWPAFKIISCCVLYNNNLTGGATWRLECFDGAAQSGTKVYDSGTVAALPAKGWGEFVWGVDPWAATVFTGWGAAYSVLWFTGVTVRSWRITLTDASNPAGFLQAKRLVMGNYFEPAVNAEYGLQLQWEDDSAQQRTQGGSLRTDRRARYRSLAGTLGRLDASERAVFMEACRVAGLASEIFVSVYPGAGGSQERDYSMLGKFVRMPRNTDAEVANWKSTFQIEEV
jgi:hypothetical protein